jgi:hypothetical protein
MFAEGGRALDQRELDARTELLRNALERNTTPGEYARLLLYDLVQTFDPVPEDERERYEDLLAREEYRAVREYDATWAERLMLTGFLEGKRQTLKLQIVSKFGQPPPWVEGRIDSIVSETELDSYLEGILTARCLSDLALDR